MTVAGIPWREHRDREVPPCGTKKAYDRHVRRGEPTDAACRAANTAVAAERRERLTAPKSSAPRKGSAVRALLDAEKKTTPRGMPLDQVHHIMSTQDDRILARRLARAGL